MVRVLDGDAHFLEGEDGLAAQVNGLVVRDEVEIAAVIQHFRLALAALEVEVLQLGADIEGVTKLRSLRELALEDIARIGGAGLALGGDDVAEHPRDRTALLRPPRQQRERARIRHGDHVALVNPGEALDGRSVKTHALFQSLLQLADGDGEALQVPEDIGEPQADELDVVGLGLFENVLFVLHLCPNSFLDCVKRPTVRGSR